MSQSEIEKFVSELKKDPKLMEEMKSYILQQSEIELTEEQLDSIVGGINSPQQIKSPLTNPIRP